MIKRNLVMVVGVLLLATLPALAGLPANPAPELDPGSVGGAVAVLAGVFLLTRDTFRKR